MYRGSGRAWRRGDLRDECESGVSLFLPVLPLWVHEDLSGFFRVFPSSAFFRAQTVGREVPLIAIVIKEDSSKSTTLNRAQTDDLEHRTPLLCKSRSSCCRFRSPLCQSKTTTRAAGRANVSVSENEFPSDCATTWLFVRGKRVQTSQSSCCPRGRQTCGQTYGYAKRLA